MSIADQVRALVGRTVTSAKVAPKDGGLGGLTPAESTALNDLLNAEPPCGCGSCACATVLREPKP